MDRSENDPARRPDPVVASGDAGNSDAGHPGPSSRDKVIKLRKKPVSRPRPKAPSVAAPPFVPKISTFFAPVENPSADSARSSPPPAPVENPSADPARSSPPPAGSTFVSEVNPSADPSAEEGRNISAGTEDIGVDKNITKSSVISEQSPLIPEILSQGLTTQTPIQPPPETLLDLPPSLRKKRLQKVSASAPLPEDTIPAAGSVQGAEPAKQRKRKTDGGDVAPPPKKPSAPKDTSDKSALVSFPSPGLHVGAATKNARAIAECLKHGFISCNPEIFGDYVPLVQQWNDLDLGEMIRNTKTGKIRFVSRGNSLGMTAQLMGKARATLSEGNNFLATRCAHHDKAVMTRTLLFRNLLIDQPNLRRQYAALGKNISDSNADNSDATSEMLKQREQELLGNIAALIDEPGPLGGIGPGSEMNRERCLFWAGRKGGLSTSANACMEKEKKEAAQARSDLDTMKQAYEAKLQKMEENHKSEMDLVKEQASKASEMKLKLESWAKSIAGIRATMAAANFPASVERCGEKVQEERAKNKIPDDAEASTDDDLVALHCAAKHVKVLGTTLWDAALMTYAALWPDEVAPKHIRDIAEAFMDSEARVSEWQASAARAGADEALAWVASWFERLPDQKGPREGSAWLSDPAKILQRQRIAHNLAASALYTTFVDNLDPEAQDAGTTDDASDQPT